MLRCVLWLVLYEVALSVFMVPLAFVSCATVQAVYVALCLLPIPCEIVAYRINRKRVGPLAEYRMEQLFATEYSRFELIEIYVKDLMDVLRHSEGTVNAKTK